MVNERAAQSLHPGVVSATLLGVTYSQSLLDKSYGSQDDAQHPEAIAEGRRLLLGPFSDLLTHRCRSLAYYSFSTYFRQASLYWVV